jgi:hypothetical protein
MVYTDLPHKHVPCCCLALEAQLAEVICPACLVRLQALHRLASPLVLAAPARFPACAAGAPATPGASLPISSAVTGLHSKEAKQSGEGSIILSSSLAIRNEQPALTSAHTSAGRGDGRVHAYGHSVAVISMLCSIHDLAHLVVDADALAAAFPASFPAPPPAAPGTTP